MCACHRLSAFGINHDDFQLILREEAVHGLQRGDAEEAVVIRDGLLQGFALIGGGGVENSVAPHGRSRPPKGVFECLIGFPAFYGRAQGLDEGGIAAEVFVDGVLALLDHLFLEVILQTVDGQLHGGSVLGGQLPGVGLARIIDVIAGPYYRRPAQFVEGTANYPDAFVAWIAPYGFLCPLHLLGCSGHFCIGTKQSVVDFCAEGQVGVGLCESQQLIYLSVPACVVAIGVFVSQSDEVQIHQQLGFAIALSLVFSLDGSSVHAISPDIAVLVPCPLPEDVEQVVVEVR